MKYTKSIFSMMVVLMLFFLPSYIWSSHVNSIEELKTKIIVEGFTKEYLDQYEFYILNNSIDSLTESGFLSKLNDSFEKEYSKALLQYKSSDFETAFTTMFPLLDNLPAYYPYYNLLSKTASVVGFDDKLENKLKELPANSFKYYLTGLIKYHKSNYTEAKKLFEKAASLDTLSYYIMYRLAYTNRYLGDSESAFKYLNKAKKVIAVNKYLIAQIDVALGSLYYLSGDLANAKVFYKRGTVSAIKSGFNIELSKAKLNLAMILDEEGKIKKSRKLFISSINLAHKINDVELGAICLSELAVSYTYSNELIKARESYESSLVLFKKLKNKKRIANTANNIANLFLSISNYRNALNYYNIAIKNAGDDVRIKMTSYRGLGDVYTNLSNYSKALNFYKKAKDISDRIKDISANIKTNLGLGVLYYNLSQPGKTLKILLDGIDKLKNSANPYLMLEVQQNLGFTYYSMNRLKKAKEHLRKSAALSSKYGDVYNELLSNTYLTFIDIEKGNFNKARINLLKLINSSLSNELYQLAATQYIALANIEGKTGNHSKQIHFLKSANKFAVQSFDFETSIEANYQLALIYESEKNLSLAEKHFTDAVEMIEKNANNLFDKADIQIKYFYNYYDIYSAFAELYLRQGKLKKAFSLIDRARSRNTRQNLAHLKLSGNKTALNSLSNLYDLGWSLQNGLISGNKIDSVKNVISREKKQLGILAPALMNSFSDETNFNFKETQNILRNDQFIISFFPTKKSIEAFVISKSGLKLFDTKLTTKSLKKLLSNISPYYNPKFQKKEITFNKDLFAFNAIASNALYKDLLFPVIKDIPKGSEIIFSLPLALISIPLELLVINSNLKGKYYLKDKKFLIDEYTISYTPSVQIWTDLSKKKSSVYRKALLVGDPKFRVNNVTPSSVRGLAAVPDIYSRSTSFAPLKYSRREINSIGKLLNDNEILLSNNATETNFKKFAGKASIIHLSTHSILYKDNPIILFSSDDSINDGFLEVGEIQDLKLSSNLVVLSSCKSGLGTEDKAEGIMGMEKAFFEAGASSVVVSLWDVSDKYTAKLMTYFYSFLAKGYTKPKALRLAKQKFIKDDSPNPYYWAAFTISGNGAPIKLSVSTNQFLKNFIYVFFAVILIIMFFYMAKKKWTERLNEK